jgi:hypothetical protein
MTLLADIAGNESEDRAGTAAAASASDPVDVASLVDRVANVHDRLRLMDVRTQRLVGEVFGELPLSVDSVSVSVAAPEVLVEPPRVACRFTERVALLGEGEKQLAVVEVVLVLEFALDGQEDLDGEAVAVYVDRNAFFIAHPYLREAVQMTTSRLGLDAVVLGVLGRDEDRPSGVTLVRRAPQL